MGVVEMQGVYIVEDYDQGTLRAPDPDVQGEAAGVHIFEKSKLKGSPRHTGLAHALHVEIAGFPVFQNLPVLWVIHLPRASVCRGGEIVHDRYRLLRGGMKSRQNDHRQAGHDGQGKCPATTTVMVTTQAIHSLRWTKTATNGTLKQPRYENQLDPHKRT
jgi:hypothetical protein